MDGLKKRLEEVKGKWVEELPHVLWAYRMTPRRSIGETPISMMYGSEAIIPLEMGFPTMRVDWFDNINNEQLLSNNLDLVKVRREFATVRLEQYQ